MSDPLDPTNAILEGISAPFVRLLTFLAVSGGGSLLGTTIHEVPNWVLVAPTIGLGRMMDLAHSIDPAAPLYWLGMMMHSLIIWWLFPFVLVWLYLLLKLWRDGEIFPIIVAVAILQPVHAFLYQFRQKPPLTTTDAILVSVAFVVTEACLVALLLWWYHVKENAPEIPPEEPEPEL